MLALYFLSSNIDKQKFINSFKEKQIMKLFTKNTFRNLALSALSAVVLSACGGAGSCTSCVSPTPAPGELTLSIAAPTQYPAGLPTPIEASLTMTNTSSVNASNLVYTIPAPNQVGNWCGNYT